MTQLINTVKSLVAFTQIVRDPNRLDVVFDLIDTLTDDPAAIANLEQMLVEEPIRVAAERRLRLPLLKLDELALRPEGSLGWVAGQFFRAHGLDPAALPRRETRTDVEWLSAHLYETHDLWHVVTGFGPDVPGELGLQAFYVTQVEGLVAHAILTAGMMNTMLFHHDRVRPRLEAIARGWQLGVAAKSLVGMDWGAHLSTPLVELRRSLNIHIDADLDAMARFAPIAKAA